VRRREGRGERGPVPLEIKINPKTRRERDSRKRGQRSIAQVSSWQTTTLIMAGILTC